MKIEVSENMARYYAYVAINTLTHKLRHTPAKSKATIASALGCATEPWYKDASLRAPLFVTWNTVCVENGEIADKELRGCIGTFAELKLPEAVEQYALVAALEDPRFPRMTGKELEKITSQKGGHKKLDLQCVVTLLGEFEDISHTPNEWTVGEHGVRLAFSWQGQRYSGTFLPEVAHEQGWDRAQTLDALVRKAGLAGVRFSQIARDAQQLSIERYRGEVGRALVGEFDQLFG